MKSCKSLCLTAILGAVATAPLGTVAPAAVIQWGTPQTIASDAEVRSTSGFFNFGQLEFAYNLGGTGTGSTNVNGVLFTPFIVTGSNSSASSGRLSLNTFNPQDPSPISLFGGVGAGSTSSPYSLLSNNYKQLLGTEVSTGGIVSMNATISGLTFGRQYLIQLWVNYSSANSGPFSLDFPARTLDPNSTNASGGVGQWVEGSFFASGTSQGFTLSTNGAGAIHFNALQLRSFAVPEPSSLMLVVVSALALATRKYRGIADDTVLAGGLKR